MSVEVAVVINEVSLGQLRPVLDAFFQALRFPIVVNYNYNPEYNPQAVGGYDAVFIVVPIATPRVAEKIDRAMFDHASLLCQQRQRQGQRQRPFVLATWWTLEAAPISAYEMQNGKVANKPWLVVDDVRVILHHDNKLVLNDPLRLTEDTLRAVSRYIGNSQRQAGEARLGLAQPPPAQLAVAARRGVDVRQGVTEKQRLVALIAEMEDVLQRAKLALALL
jgi:hypothetical protein